MNDDPVGVLAALYFRSANHMSRGTWTSTEELGGYSQALDGRGVPRGGAGSGITPWTGMQYAVQLKEVLLWTHPDTETTWIGRATPREWLEPGKRIRLTNATTVRRYSIMLACAGCLWPMDSDLCWSLRQRRRLIPSHL